MFLSLTKSDEPVAKNITNIIDKYEIVFSMPLFVRPLCIIPPLSIKCLRIVQHDIYLFQKPCLFVFNKK